MSASQKMPHKGMNRFQPILLRLDWMKKWYIHVDVHRKLHEKKLHEKSTRWILDVFGHGIFSKLTKDFNEMKTFKVNLLNKALNVSAYLWDSHKRNITSGDLHTLPYT